MQEDTVLATPVIQEDLLHRFFKSIWFLILPGYLLISTIITSLLSAPMMDTAREYMNTLIARLEEMGTIVEQSDLTQTSNLSPSTFLLLLAIAVIIYDAFKRKQMRKTPFQVIKVLYYISFGACILIAILTLILGTMIPYLQTDEARILSLFFMAMFCFVAVYAIFSFLLARLSQGIEHFITLRRMSLPRVTGLVILCAIFAISMAYGAMQLPNLPSVLPDIFSESEGLTELIHFYVIMIYLQAGTFVVAIVSLIQFRMFAKEIGA